MLNPMLYGDLLTVGIALAGTLAIIAILERVFGRDWLPSRLRKPNGMLDRLLRRNGAVHALVSETMFAGLVCWAMIESVTDGLTHFLDSLPAGGLAGRAVDW